MQCSAVMKKKRLCRIEADRMEPDGSWVCHIHHRDGLFQKQRQAAREDRKRLRQAGGPASRAVG